MAGVARVRGEVSDGLKGLTGPLSGGFMGQTKCVTFKKYRRSKVPYQS